jgi:RNA polymerase sigma-70 factor, ECF subfamily
MNGAVGSWVGTPPFQVVLGRARRGDDSAFAALWRWLHPSILRWLRVVSPGSADDVASEVWLSVATGLDGFEGTDRDFRAWVFTIARRRSIDFARRRERQPLNYGLDGIDCIDTEDATTEAVDRAAAVEAALAMLRGLTPEQAEVVALRVVAGLSVPETASVVGKSEGAVRVLCHRGLRTLAVQLAHLRLTPEVTS